MQCHKKRVLRHGQRSEPLDSLVFKPFQCCTPRTDDLTEGSVGFRSPLATDGRDMPCEWKCSAIPFLNSLQNICKGRQLFLPLPVLLTLFFHLLYLSLHMNLEASLHNLLGSCVLSLLVSAFLSPAAWQSCCRGMVVGVCNGYSTGVCPLFLHRICAEHLLPLSHHWHTLIDSPVLCR